MRRDIRHPVCPGNGPQSLSRDGVLAALSRILAASTLGLTLLPLWRTARGWVRIWDFPRGQIAGLGVLAQAGMLTWAHTRLGDRALTAVLGGTLLYQAAKILPYTPLYPPQVLPASDHRPERRIRLLMANVLQDNRRADLMLQAVRQAAADVVCLVETDDWWERAMRPLEREYAWTTKCPLNNAYGMILYSRLALTATATRFLVRPQVPSMRAVVRLRSGHEIVLYAVHPRPPLPQSPTYGRDAELVLVGREVARERKPAVVIGDLNDVAWSYTTTLFQRVSHTVDPRVGRGMFNTFHASHPLLRYPLDHVFHTRDFTLVELRRLSHTGSDHFPILVELAYTPSRKDTVEQPALTKADQARAEGILDDAREVGLRRR